MRKFLLATLTLVMLAGLSIGAQVRFVKFDEKTKELTVKEGKKGEDKEATYKLGDDVKYFDGKNEIKAEDAFKKFTGEKAVRGFDLKLNDDKKVEKITFGPGGKGKGKKKDN